MKWVLVYVRCWNEWECESSLAGVYDSRESAIDAIPARLTFETWHSAENLEYGRDQFSNIWELHGFAENTYKEPEYLQMAEDELFDG